VQFVYVSGVSAGNFIIGLSEVYDGGGEQALKEENGGGEQALKEENGGARQVGEGRDAEGVQEDKCGKDAEGAHVLWIHQRVKSGRCGDLDGSVVEVALREAASRTSTKAGEALNPKALREAASRAKAGEGRISGEGRKGRISGEGRKGRISGEGGKGRISGEGGKGRISAAGSIFGSGGHVPLEKGSQYSPKGRIISLDGVQGVVDLEEGRAVVSVPWCFPMDGETHETAADRCKFEAYNLLQVILPVPYHRFWPSPFSSRANEILRFCLRAFRGFRLF
jgi:hypothetical protein